MVVIESSTDIGATRDKVWRIISDLDNEPKYWKGTKEVKNLERTDNTIKRQVTIAFRDQKCIQEVKIFPKDKIVANFTEGIIKGTKTVRISENEGKCKLEAIWDIKLGGMMGMFTGMIKKHIKNGTDQALQSIKQEAEEK